MREQTHLAPCIAALPKISLWLHLAWVSVRRSCHLLSIASEIWFRQLMWVRHVACMPHGRLLVQVLFGQLPGPGNEGRLHGGGPHGRLCSDG